MFGDDTMNGQTVSNLIRSKTDIVDIIGERIPLVKKGKNFFGICPFHDDTNPSMSVSREKQIYTCFTCHATGNVFKFLMDYEKMSFPEALKYLGDRVGVDTNSVRLKKVNNNNDKYYTCSLRKCMTLQLNIIKIIFYLQLVVWLELIFRKEE